MQIAPIPKRTDTPRTPDMAHPLLTPSDIETYQRDGAVLFRRI